MNQHEARPIIPSIQENIGSKDIETFQNQTLRPIIKMLHSSLVLHFYSVLIRKKSVYFKLSIEHKNPYIQSIFKTEQRYKAEIKGMVMGHFQPKEFEYYLANAPQIDKRIYSIIEERILSNQRELMNLK